MINSTQNAFDKLKKDLQSKDQQLEIKEKEISYLRGQLMTPTKKTSGGLDG